MPPRCASLQQTSTVKLVAFFHKFKKIVYALRVNETKVTLRNAFIDNIFALESEKESKNDGDYREFAVVSKETTANS